MKSDSFNKPAIRLAKKVIRGFDSVDQILRGHCSQISQVDDHLLPRQAGALSLRRVVAVVLVLGPIYGIAMGSYAFVSGDRVFFQQIPQMFYSGIKMPLLIVFTVLVALPSFFVINTLMGLRQDFRESLRAIISAQAGLMIILVSLFPLTLFSYVAFGATEVSYQLAVLFNAAMFGLASVAAQVLLRSYYQPLIDRDPRHRWMVRMWIFVFAFVGIQAGYVLRPFIGNPATPISFLRKESFENAYVKLFDIVRHVVESVELTIGT